jgi:hypothetical protein
MLNHAEVRLKVEVGQHAGKVDAAESCVVGVLIELIKLSSRDHIVLPKGFQMYAVFDGESLEVLLSTIHAT